jgi:hypothetical protein
MIRTYTMTAHDLKRRITYYANTICYTCNVEISIGDLVTTKTGAKQGKLIRHESCARRVGLI